ncbi:hypothetical protein CANTEDRAFT_130247 [Yamadazyma tenuis ATCC 10573]|uniref:Uncharacterized protein n=1 Tax=Candida tenuis (strain ATCC 10573 / BCRC 21748 / CBS 615 / JCM 9827 / NBRC 10315 / NRRL Y-1498 / VKM Y-70) TaxID=590646 RepID=G3B4U0_CANTC|nr:uncharacterized protein CANTEDRAFT_130247 [Yamadazyma tenuis ATCC 10573]EGV63870.1 hypothetical protein CANTEDRAFT_130247 [Yamadazyma tenuis ATCC 10573]
MAFARDRINAFPEGNSLVEYNPHINKLLVVNSVGILKIFKIDNPELEPTSVDVLENLTSLSSSNDKLLVANTAGHLELVDLNTNESKGIVYRSELPLRDSVLINEGKRLVCGGDDDKLIIINLEEGNSSSSIKLPQQVVNISYCMNAEILAVSLSNGDVQIYSTINEEPNLLETLKSAVSSKIHSSMDEIDYSDDHKHELVATKCQWLRNGEFLLTPSSEGIRTYNRDWELEKEFKFGNDADSIIDFKVSSNGRSVAVLNKDFKVVVFDSVSGDVTNKFDLENSEDLFINLEWYKDQLFLGSNKGVVTQIKDFIDSASKGSLGDIDDDGGSNTDVLASNSDAEPNGINRNAFDDSIIDAEDESDEDFPYYNKDVGSVLDRHKKRHRGNDGKITISQSAVEGDLLPYSPGSTPFSRSANVERRYLTMNSIGYVWVVKTDETEGSQQSITVSFFDRSVNKDYHFNDYHKFDLCGINRHGVLLGHSNYQSSKSYGSLYYRSHESDQESWDKKIPLHTGEYLTSISITDNEDSIVVVGTSLGYLRFYNQQGLCVNIIKVNPIVSVIASSINSIFLVSRLSVNLYSFSIINCYDYKFIQQDAILPLKSDWKSPLIKGIFFNEYNDPCLVPGNDDTLMILSSWREPSNSKWIPILNCAQEVTDNNNASKKNWKCWPLGLFGDKLNCILSKNNDQYPGFPLAMPIELSIKMPINHIDTSQSEQQEDEDYEENYVKAKAMGIITNDSLTDQDYQEFNDEISDKLAYYSNLFDKSLLKLFADTCKQGNLPKSYSIAKLMKNDKALIAASKICQRFEFNNLAVKIGKLRDSLVDFDDVE